jgi:hypothetical protein
MNANSSKTPASESFEKPASGPKGLIFGETRHRVRDFIFLSCAALGCFVVGIVLDALLRPTPAERVLLAVGAFAGYLVLGRRALMALVPELDRWWRKDSRRMKAVAVVALVSVAAGRARAQQTTPPDQETPTPSAARSSFGGWIELGYAANSDRPRDRVNFGANFGWRSNDYRLNQVYLSAQKPLEHVGQSNFGYRVDFLAGHDAPFYVANGLFSNFTGFDPTSGIGVNGPKSYRNVNRIGIDLSQFYLEVHVPRVITEAGVDVRVGKFFTLMGREVYPAADTDFYSRAYENVYATPFTHTGILVTLHASPSLDVVAGVVRGWDVFADNNDSVSFHGAFVWNSSDKRYNWTTTWITGPEQPNNNRDYRSLVTSYLTASLDSRGEWVLSTGGHYAYEPNAATNAETGLPKSAKWYGYTVNLFRTVSPRLRLGSRIEWFRDEEGTRTAVLGRPGFSASFFEATLGATCKLHSSLSLRPEVRLDWSPNARPYNDQADRSQFTAALDVIWKF